MSTPVLITGGLGYVGGRIALHLAEQGLDVRVSTRKPTESLPDWTKQVEVVPADLSDDTSLDAACHGVTAVVHLAAMNEIQAASDPIGALQVNGVGTANLLEAAKRAGVQRIVYMSTAHVYGAPLVGDIDETTLPRPTHPYATSHKAAEDAVLAANDRGEIESVVLRLSNGFGAPTDLAVDRWSLLVNDLCWQAATASHLTLRTPGTQERDFITLTDVANGVAFALALEATRLGDGLYNLGGGASRSIFEMTTLIADRAKHCFGSRLQIERPDPNPDETAQHLNYQMDKLIDVGFALHGSANDEIDRMLLMCRKAADKRA
jgi:UDP-glucose 4-epimerase